MVLTVAMLATLGASHASTTLDPAAVGTIVVSIEGFRNESGHARVALFNQGTGFPEDASAAFRSTISVIQGGRVEVHFDDVPFGDYSVAMFHDENDDGKLNKGLFGIPSEGYGVSNNVTHATHAPRFTEALFTLAEASHTVSIRVHY
jgi:uncharacterized protein (DUF2141 family)